MPFHNGVADRSRQAAFGHPLKNGEYRYHSLNTDNTEEKYPVVLQNNNKDKESVLHNVPFRHSTAHSRYQPPPGTVQRPSLQDK